MALFEFTKSIINSKPIKVFNKGQMMRDFTYIDDIIESLFRVINKIPLKDEESAGNSDLSNNIPYKIFNIGNSNPVPLMDFISEIEKIIGTNAKKEFLEMQPGDVENTCADTTSLENWIKYKPRTSVSKGIKEFINWYKNYYNVK